METKFNSFDAGSLASNGSLDTPSGISQCEQNLLLLRDIYDQDVAFKLKSNQRKVKKKKKKNEMDSDSIIYSLPTLSNILNTYKGTSGSKYQEHRWKPDKAIADSSSNSYDQVKDETNNTKCVPIKKKRHKKLKPLKSFCCRHPGCNHRFSIAFEQVVHEQTCEFIDLRLRKEIILTSNLKIPNNDCFLKSTYNCPDASYRQQQKYKNAPRVNFEHI